MRSFFRETLIRQTRLLGSFAALLASITLAYAERSRYEIVKSAPQFAIGGVGYAGIITSEELAMRTLRDGPRAKEQLRKLLREATLEGQMYALFALRQLNVPDWQALSQPYRHSSVTQLQLTVREYKALSDPHPRGSPVINRMDGCIQHSEAVSDTVEWIDKWAVKIKSWEKKT